MKYLALIILLIQIQIGYCQKMEMRPLEELINKEDSGYRLIENWLREAKNEVEILEKDQTKDDAIGGFFALNGGGLGNEDLGKIYYFLPENLEWESLGIGYSEFIYWTFSGDIKQFYEDLRWKRWKKEVKEMGADRVMSFYPFLWTHYDSLEKLLRKDVPIEEIWGLQMDVRNQLMNNH